VTNNLFKEGDRVVITGSRPAKGLRGRRATVVVDSDTHPIYTAIIVDGEEYERVFRHEDLTAESEWDSPLMKALR
jgi:hypothetical protein